MAKNGGLNKPVQDNSGDFANFVAVKQNEDGTSRVVASVGVSTKTYSTKGVANVVALFNEALAPHSITVRAPESREQLDEV